MHPSCAENLLEGLTVHRLPSLHQDGLEGLRALYLGGDPCETVWKDCPYQVCSKTVQCTGSLPLHRLPSGKNEQHCHVACHQICQKVCETCYKNCHQVVCRPVQTTCYKQVCENICKPVCETVMKQVQETCYKRLRPDSLQELRQVGVCPAPR